MNKAFISWIGVAIVIMIGFFVFFPSTPESSNTNGNGSTNVVVKNGVQYITVKARGGYSPRTTIAQGGIPTKLIMETNNTYDCSSSLVVRAANYRGMLPQTGETEIDLGTPKSGEKIQGTCSMGMYNFAINVN